MSQSNCTVCAWRETCNKRFTVTDCGAHCPDFSRDVSIKGDGKETDTPTDTKERHHT